MQGRLASETLSALAGTLAARPSSVLFDPHATRVDPYQALISTASYQTTFDRTGAMLSGYDLMGGAGPTLGAIFSTCLSSGIALPMDSRPRRISGQPI